MMTRLLTILVPYTFNRNGYYYFSRRVPRDLAKHYHCSRDVVSLRTKSASVARTRATVEAAKLDDYWSRLRIGSPRMFGQHLLKANVSLQIDTAPALDSLSLHDAAAVYLAAKGADKAKTFRAAVERSCRYLVEAAGAKQLHEYTRKDALAFRDHLVSKGLAGSSVDRVFTSLLSVVNFAIKEHALSITNVFSGVYIDRTKSVARRQPIPINHINNIQSACKTEDDDLRWLIALISDTGMRLAEAAGLAVEDIKLDCDVPYINVQPRPWRSLKTPSSERKIPLVGASLWAAERILVATLESPFAFPRYNQANVTSANSASAALNKWLKQYGPAGCTIHSFRHSFRDRLRVAQCPTEMIDQLGGWSRQAIGERHGSGYGLSQTHESMLAITLT